MPFAEPPPCAAWRHLDARQGFEVVFFSAAASGYRVEGHTTAVEDGEAWSVGYTIDVDAAWATRTARVTGRSQTGLRTRTLERAGAGRWRVDGEAAPYLDGCLDVDLESSSCTNAFPVRRLALGRGEGADAPAAYVRAVDLVVERLEQRYVCVGPRAYDYAAPAFGVRCRLDYDERGLVVDYPGIAARAG